MGKNKKWQFVALYMIMALFISALPSAISYAQETPISAQQVCGELPEQFDKHYLELRPIDNRNDMELVMAYSPNDNRSLRSGSGFVVFNQSQFDAALRRGGNLFHPSVAKTGVGSDSPGSKGLSVKRATLPGDALNIVVINDSTIPLAYCLSGRNITIIDQSGEQVRNGDQTIVMATDPTATTDSLLVPDSAAGIAQPTVLRTTTLQGVLDVPFQVHLYPLDVANTDQNVELRLSDINSAGINLVVFTEAQMQDWIRSGLPPTSPLLNSIVAGPDASLGDPVNVKRANIQQPVPRFIAAVYNGSISTSPYELRIVNENGVLIDEWVQSTRAQQIQGNTTTTEMPEDSSTVATVTSTVEPTTAPTATITVSAALTATPTTIPTATVTNTVEASPSPIPTATITFSAEPTATPTATSAVATSSSDTIGTGTYTVVRGDTIGSIARRAYGDLQLYDELCAYNKLANCNRIEVGDLIQIPARNELGGVAPVTTTIAATAIAVTTTAVPPTPSTATDNIVAIITDLNTLDTVRLMLELLESDPDQSNHVKTTLSGAGPYTLFAPVDTAFTELSKATLEGLIKNPAELAKMLRLHIVPGAFSTTDLTDGMVLTSLTGVNLPVSIDTDGIITIDSVPIVEADIPAANGFIQAISAVLPSQFP